MKKFFNNFAEDVVEFLIEVVIEGLIDIFTS